MQTLETNLSIGTNGEKIQLFCKKSYGDPPSISLTVSQESPSDRVMALTLDEIDALITHLMAVRDVMLGR